MSERIYYSREAAERARREQLLILTFAAGLSISIGVAIALLFAPQSGNQTRQQLTDQFGDSVEKGRHAAENASDQIRDRAEKARENFNDRVQAFTG